MDNDDDIRGQILTRRHVLRLTAATGVTAMFGLFGHRTFGAPPLTTQPRLPLVASPVLTEGPFFVDEKLNRSDLVAGTTRASVLEGVPLELNLSIYKLSGATYTPLMGAQVDLWHADAFGVYSDEDHPMNHENTAKETWLRGFQETDDRGVVQFKTIYPGWYPGRAPHVHFKVRQFDNAMKQATKEFTSQLFFSDADSQRVYAKKPYNDRHGRYMPNAADGIYNENQKDGTTAGQYLTLDLKSNAEKGGFIATFPIILTDATMDPSTHDHGESGLGGRRGPGDDSRSFGGRRPPPPPGW